MKTALVTGSEGFLGRHFVQELADRGYEVIEIDIRNGHDLRTMEDRYVDLAVHCAGNVGGRMGIDWAPLWVAESLELDRAMAQWVLECAPAAYLYISSSAMYSTHWQNNGTHRLNELIHTPTGYGEPDGIYGYVKVIGEKHCEFLSSLGCRVHVVRPFSGYGHDQDLDYPFPAYIKRAVEGEDPFNIWGPGTQIRDFIHVSDVVNGALAVVDNDYRYPVNLCTGVGTTFLELADMITKMAGYSPEFRTQPEKPVGVLRRVGHPGTTQRFYTPKVSLEDGVRLALENVS